MRFPAPPPPRLDFQPSSLTSTYDSTYVHQHVLTYLISSNKSIALSLTRFPSSTTLYRYLYLASLPSAPPEAAVHQLSHHHAVLLRGKHAADLLPKLVLQEGGGPGYSGLEVLLKI